MAGVMSTLVPAPKPVILRPWQVKWFERIYEILTYNHGFIDTSNMGSGKTYTTLKIAQQIQAKILVVCPLIMIEVWKKAAAEYGVPLVDEKFGVISYQSLRSQKNCQPSHGFLHRHDRMTGGVSQTYFTATDRLKQIYQEPTLVILDEIQNIKNNSAQYKACRGLLEPIFAGGITRYALLSGTPFDKEEHVVNLLRLIGFINEPRLFNYIAAQKKLVLEGIQELIDICRQFDRQVTDKILVEHPPIHRSKMAALAYKLYVGVLKHHISGAMPSPEIKEEFDVKNGYYKISEHKQRELNAAIKELADKARYNADDDQAEYRQENFGAIKQALRAIENAKCHDMARVARKIMTNQPNSKVVIAVNFTSSLETLFELLELYNPLALYGQTKPKDRQAIIQAFNEDPAFRVLIMNTVVGSTGISLHDTVGDSPRYMLISPDYNMLGLVQAASRIYRAGTQSAATVRVFYGQDDGSLHETAVLTALAVAQALNKKSEVVRGTLAEGVNTRLILPADYAAEMEA